MPQQPYHHGDLKAQLIEQGLKLLDAQGYERFSLREAAKRCGVSQTAPYRHFQEQGRLNRRDRGTGDERFRATASGRRRAAPRRIPWRS